MTHHPNDGVPIHSIRALEDRDLLAGTGPARAAASVEDLLQAVPDRSDLERLYERNVPLRQILALLGHQVDSRQIARLLHCENPRAEIRRILRSA
jgi:hypothetical protein